MKTTRPLVLAHRGSSSKKTENTLSAFRAALNAGADGWECDIQKTRDGRFAVIHDESVERIAGKKGLVKDMTLSQIGKIRLPGNENIPSLECMLKILPAGKFLNLELKAETIRPADCPEILGVLTKNRRNRSNLLVSSFEIPLLEFFRRKEIPVGLLVGNNVGETGFFRFFRDAFRLDPDYFNLPVQSLRGRYRFVTGPLIRLWKFRKKKIAFWVVNNNEDLKRCARSADMILTDDPEWLVSRLK